MARLPDRDRVAVVEPPGASADRLSRNARLVLLTSLIGWTLANMDQSFFTWAYPDIQKDLHISLTQVSYLYDGIFISGWLATFAVGPLMDRLGRRPLFAATLITSAIGSVISAVTSIFGVLFAGRVVASAGSSAENFTSQVMNIESIPPRRKGMLVALAQIGYPLGYFLSAGIALVALGTIGWHGLFFIGIAPFVFVIVLRIFVREPKRSKEILELRKAARSSAADPPGSSRDRLEDVQLTYDVKRHEAVRSPLAQLFLPDLRRTTIFMSLWFFLVNIANAEASVYLPTIGAQRGLTQPQVQLLEVVTTALAVAAYFANAYIGTKIGRRNAIALFQVISIAVAVVLAFAGTSPITFSVLWVVWFFFAYGIYGSAITYIMEVFPTRARGVGSNFVGQFVWLGVLLWAAAGAGVLTTYGATASMLVTIVFIAAISLGVLLFNRNVPPDLELEEIAT